MCRKVGSPTLIGINCNKDAAQHLPVPTGTSPSDTSCERVFSLLKLMFGDQQMSTLADAIRAALMLRYNDRVVG